MIKWLSDLVCTLRIDFECVGLVGYVGIMVQHGVLDSLVSDVRSHWSGFEIGHGMGLDHQSP